MPTRRGFLKKGPSTTANALRGVAPLAQATSASSVSESGSSGLIDVNRAPTGATTTVVNTNPTSDITEFDLPSVSIEEWVQSGGNQGLKLDISSLKGKGPLPQHNPVASLRFGGDEAYTLVITWLKNCADFRQHPYFNQFPPLRSTTLDVRVGELPGKGKCLFAARNIAAGEIIVMERPLLLMMMPFPIAVTYNFTKYLSLMRPEARAAMEALHNCKPTGSMMNDMMSKCRTNCFGTKMPFDKDNEMHAVVYDVLSRANHSCEPNAYQDDDYNEFYGMLTAHRSITVGEEITIAYIERQLPRAERQAQLKAKYDFECRCGKCQREATPKHKTAKSSHLQKAINNSTQSQPRKNVALEVRIPKEVGIQDDRATCQCGGDEKFVLVVTWPGDPSQAKGKYDFCPKCGRDGA